MDLGFNSETDRDRWLEERYNSVTCTDLGKILGVDYEISRKKLLLLKIEKRDSLENASDTTKLLVKLGSIFESQVREMYKVFISPELGFIPSMHCHTTHRFFTGSPDYIVPALKRVVEFKTHFFPDPETARPIDQVYKIPLKYYLQVQGYLEIMDYEDAHLVSWTLRNGNSIFQIKRDKDLFNKLILPAIQEFYNWLSDVIEGRMGSNLNFAIFKRGEKDLNINRIYDSLVQNTKNIHTSYY